MNSRVGQARAKPSWQYTGITLIHRAPQHLAPVTLSFTAVRASPATSSAIAWHEFVVYLLYRSMALQVADYVADDALVEWVDLFWCTWMNLHIDDHVVNLALQLMLQQHDALQHKLAQLHPLVQRICDDDLPYSINVLPHPLLVAHRVRHPPPVPARAGDANEHCVLQQRKAPLRLVRHSGVPRNDCSVPAAARAAQCWRAHRRGHQGCRQAGAAAGHAQALCQRATR